MAVFQAESVSGRAIAPHDINPRANSPHEVRSLDGLRALAALGVLFFHTYGMYQADKTFLGWDVRTGWYYTQTGVHLFFVLSGFLLFLPYARAILSGAPLPSVRSFYRRRALRILPAYWVCLAVLALVQWSAFASPWGLANIATHVVLLHDLVPDFNRAVEGPFWTLALEAQFYLILPLLAWAIARVARGAHVRWRLGAAVLGLIVGALIVRDLDALGQQHLTQLHGIAATLDTTAVTLTLGSQGKFLEVFGVGMLGATLYVTLGEQRGAEATRVRAMGWALIVLSAALMLTIAPLVMQRGLEAPNHTMFTDPGDLAVICGPLLIGMGYGALLLGILWAGPLARAPFETNVMVFLGLMSYSLYLWHLPIVAAAIPVFRLVPVPVRIVCAVAIAYLSYRLVEVPFLRRRRAASQAAPIATEPVL